MVSQDCITSFTQGFFSVPRNDVISRPAEVLLQVANTFPPLFHGYPPSAAVNKSWKVWSWSEAGLPCWRAVTYFSLNHLSLRVIRNRVHCFSQNDLVQNHISRKMQFLREQDWDIHSQCWRLTIMKAMIWTEVWSFGQVCSRYVSLQIIGCCGAIWA